MDDLRRHQIGVLVSDASQVSAYHCHITAQIIQQDALLILFDQQHFVMRNQLGRAAAHEYYEVVQLLDFVQIFFGEELVARPVAHVQVIVALLQFIQDYLCLGFLVDDSVPFAILFQQPPQPFFGFGQISIRVQNVKQFMVVLLRAEW